MKKWLAFVLALVFALVLMGCSEKEPALWDWVQGLNHEDEISATPWKHDAEYNALEALDDTETQELITLLNKLTKSDFTENKKLVGITPTFGILIEIDSESYHINYAPSPYGKYGTLEIGYGGKTWWIDSTELTEFILRVTNTQTIS